MELKSLSYQPMKVNSDVKLTQNHETVSSKMTDFFFQV